MVRFKIYNTKTPNHGENLCDTCSHSIRREGFAASQVEMFCHGIGHEVSKITHPVAKCSKYRDKDQESADQYYQDALYYVPKLKKFVTRRQFNHLMMVGKIEEE